jgi:hypothetical protein
MVHNMAQKRWIGQHENIDRLTTASLRCPNFHDYRLEEGAIAPLRFDESCLTHQLQQSSH